MKRIFELLEILFLRFLEIITYNLEMISGDSTKRISIYTGFTLKESEEFIIKCIKLGVMDIRTLENLLKLGVVDYKQIMEGL